MPCKKRFYRDKIWRQSVGQQSGTKSGHGPADKPLVIRSSAARYVRRFGLHAISFVRAFEETSRTVVFGALEVEMNDCSLGAWPYLALPLAARPRLAPPRPAPPRPAVPRFEPPCVRYVWVSDSTGSHIISFVRASEEKSSPIVFAALEGKRDGCLLGEANRRRIVLFCSLEP